MKKPLGPSKKCRKIIEIHPVFEIIGSKSSRKQSFFYRNSSVFRRILRQKSQFFLVINLKTVRTQDTT